MKKPTRKLKKIPTFKTDDEAETFVATADLSEYDLTGTFVRFEFEPKDSRLNMRLPRSLMTTVKAQASKRGIPYTRFVREALEVAVSPRK